MKGLLALLFAIGVALSAPVALVAYNIETRFLTASETKALIAQSGFYDQLPVLAASAAAEDKPDYARGASPEDMQRFFRTLLTREAMTPYVDHAVDQFVGFARGESEAAIVSTTELKRALREGAPEAVMAAVANKPECGPGAFTEDHVWMSCRPRAADEARFRARVTDAVAQSANEIPDSFQSPEAHDVARFESEVPRALRARMTQAAAWGWLAPVGLLILIGMLFSQSRRAMAAWCGVPILIGGGLAYAITKFVEAAWANGVAEIRTDATDAGDRFGAHMAEAIGRAFFEPVLLQSAVMAGIGATLVLMAFVIHDDDASPGPWPG